MRQDRDTPSGRSGGEISGLTAMANPLDFIADDHMREREVCALIDALVSARPVSGTDLHRMLDFLDRQLPLHLADEETDLFPMMQDRCDPEDEIEKVIAKLHSDHDHAIADAPAIIAILRRVEAARPPLTEDDLRQLKDFAREARRHMILENAVILPIARARLSEDDLATLKRNMLNRRDVQEAEGTDRC